MNQNWMEHTRTTPNFLLTSKPQSRVSRERWPSKCSKFQSILHFCQWITEGKGVWRGTSWVADMVWRTLWKFQILDVISLETPIGLEGLWSCFWRPSHLYICQVGYWWTFPKQGAFDLPVTLLAVWRSILSAQDSGSDPGFLDSVPAVGFVKGE